MDTFNIHNFFPEAKDNVDIDIGNATFSIWKDGDAFISQIGNDKDIILHIKTNQQYKEVTDALSIPQYHKSLSIFKIY